MDTVYNLDDIARTTDEMVVRRRFDQRNRFTLLILLGFYGFVVLLIVTTSRHLTPLDVMLGTANLALIALGFWAGRKSYGEQPSLPGRWLRKHMTAGVLTYVIVQYALLLFLSRGNHD